MNNPDRVAGASGARHWLMLGFIVVAVAGLMLLTNPVPQDPGYHRFADTRPLLGIPNFWNVASNLPFLLVGLIGLARVRTVPDEASDLTPEYRLFFAGVAATAFGSAYYHFDPGNATLLWDRLPMTVAFAGLTGLLAGIYLCRRCAHAITATWLVLGLASVLYWAMTEKAGVGDLRPYALVQFGPLLLLPVLLLGKQTRPGLNRYFWFLAALYTLAKLGEFRDAEIFGTLPVSGHTLKHVLAAVGAAALIAAMPHTPVHERR